MFFYWFCLFVYLFCLLFTRLTKKPKEVKSIACDNSLKMISTLAGAALIGDIKLDVIKSELHSYNKIIVGTD